MKLAKSIITVMIFIAVSIYASAEIQRASHKVDSDFSGAWVGGSQSQSAPFWQYTIEDPGTSNAKVIRKDLSSSNPVSENWGAAPQASQHVQPVFAHNRVITAVEKQGEWRIVSSEAGSPSPQWTDMGKAPVGQVKSFFVNDAGDLVVSNQSQHSRNAQTWRGSFGGGGAGLSWDQQDLMVSSNSSGAAVMGEFDLGEGGRMLSLTWDPEPSGIELQYRTSPAAGQPYSAWSQPVQSDSTQMNRRGRYLQYRLTRPDGSPILRDELPPIEVAYSNGESEAEKDANHYDSAQGGGVGSGGGVSVDASTDLDMMQSEEVDSDFSLDGDSVSNPSGGSSNSGASPSKASKSAPKSNSQNSSSTSNTNGSPSNKMNQPPQGDNNKNENKNEQQSPNTNITSGSSNPSQASNNNSKNESSTTDANQTDQSKAKTPSEDDGDGKNKENEPDEESKPESGEQQQKNSDGNNGGSPGPSGDGAGSGPGAAAGGSGSNSGSGGQPQEPGKGVAGAGSGVNTPASSSSDSPNQESAKQDEGNGNPGEQDQQQKPVLPLSPPTIVPFSSPASLPLSSVLSSSRANKPNGNAQHNKDAQGGGDESNAPNGEDGPANDGERPTSESGGSTGGGDQREGAAGSKMADWLEKERVNKRFGAVRPSSDGTGVAGGGSSFSTSGRTSRATDEIEFASAIAFNRTTAPHQQSSPESHSGWMWLLLAAALASWLGYRINNERMRRKEMDELLAHQAPLSAPDSLVDNSIDNQGAWEQITQYVADVKTVAVNDGVRYALMDSGDIWKEPEQSTSKSSLKHVGRVWGEWASAHLAVKDNALYFVGEDNDGTLQGRIFPLRQVSPKPKAFGPPKGLKHIQRMWHHKGRLWLQGSLNGEPVVYSAMADAAGAGSWIEETPAKFDAADSVCISSGASMFFAGAPKQDRGHLWLYTGENRSKGRLEWKPAAKTAYQGGDVFLFGDAKKCFMIEFDSQRPHLWFHVFGRGEEGEFLGRFTKEFDMPSATQVFESHVSNGRLVLAGRDPETQRVVYLQAKVKTLLGVNTN